MAVRAHDLALLNLREDAFPVPVWQGPTDAEGLGVRIQVVELEHHGIVLSAVHARMAGEVAQ